MSSSRRSLPRVLLGGLIVVAPTAAVAGSYMFANESRLDAITHPSGYVSIGGTLEVEVCIDASAPDGALMEIPVQNVIREINAMTGSSPNLVFGAANNIPPGVVDFESLTLHELGHCTGLGHPNLGSITGLVSGSDTNFTKTTDGADDLYSLVAGADGVKGSSDDDRADDHNLHWFEKLVNNPFLEVASPQASTFSRQLADLPAGHDFAANADRGVGALLGVADTEAVMQQGQGSDEDQRRLQADDVATYRMAMTGVDEIAGTADDYTIHLVYGGVQADASGCDIEIRSKTTGFGSCAISGTTGSLGPNHWRITSATFSYNSELAWFFNQVPSGCSASDTVLAFEGVTHDRGLDHEACQTITYGPDYELVSPGSVTATAPTVILANETTLGGEFTAISALP